VPGANVMILEIWPVKNWKNTGDYDIKYRNSFIIFSRKLLIFLAKIGPNRQRL
jgi:hypothetical protein